MIYLLQLDRCLWSGWPDRWGMNWNATIITTHLKVPPVLVMQASLASDPLHIQVCAGGAPTLLPMCVVLFLLFWKGSLAIFVVVPPVICLLCSIRCREDEDRETGKAEVDTKRQDVTWSQIFTIWKLYKTTYLEFVMLVSKLLIDNETICWLCQESMCNPAQELGMQKSSIMTDFWESDHN